MPATGFQAIILCGSGESLNPFNSNPKDFPKALIPIANRPMVWYPLEWCYRMGITNITLITPSICAAAISNALSQNPHLTSLPAPKPTLLAPEELTLTTGTAELFRLKEVRDVIANDFLVLPCDLVCELAGTSFLELWMSMQGAFGGSVSDGEAVGLQSLPTGRLIAPGLDGERSGRRGGLGIWYHTKDPETGSSNFGIKNEETDFIATTTAMGPILPSPNGSLQPRVRSLALSMPTSELKDVLEEKKSLQIRHALMKKYGLVKMQTTCRDAHIYFFPHWVKELIGRNDAFESIGDVIGWWAKATWQDGLGNKLRLNAIFDQTARDDSLSTRDAEGEVEIGSLSSTAANLSRKFRNGLLKMESKVPELESKDSDDRDDTVAEENTVAPVFLSYIHPPNSVTVPGSGADADAKQKGKPNQRGLPPSELQKPATPFLRRVDTVPLLLATSLYLASIPSIDSHPPNVSPYAVPTKKPTSTPLPPQSSIHTSNVLLDSNITLSPKLTLSHCVIGANCTIGSGVRISRSVLMDGVVIEDGVKLDSCVLGRRCKVEKSSELRDCWLQEGFVIPGGTTSKGEIFAGFEGGELEDDIDEFAADDFDDNAGLSDKLET